VATVEDTNVDE